MDAEVTAMVGAEPEQRLPRPGVGRACRHCRPEITSCAKALISRACPVPDALQHGQNDTVITAVVH